MSQRPLFPRFIMSLNLKHTRKSVQCVQMGFFPLVYRTARVHFVTILLGEKKIIFGAFIIWSVSVSHFACGRCKLKSFKSWSSSKVICLYAWQDSSGTPRWCVGMVPCSRRSRHFPLAAQWCSSLSPSTNGSMPSWEVITHWPRSTNGSLREGCLFQPKSWISRHPGHLLWSP